MSQEAQKKKNWRAANICIMACIVIFTNWKALLEW